MSTEASHVFISYSRRDTEAMQRIVAFLRSQNIKVWVDNEKLTPGTPIWEEEIEKAINSAFVVLVILSPDAKGSGWVRREITFADQYHKRIIPVLVRGDNNNSIPLRLITNQYIDLRKIDNEKLENLVAIILSPTLIKLPDLSAPQNIFERITKMLKSLFEKSRIQINSRVLISITGLIFLTPILWLLWLQIIFFTSTSVDQQAVSFPIVQSVKIEDNIDYKASHLFLGGIQMELDIKTASVLENQPCIITVYFKDQNNNFITTQRSFSSFFSPYISDDNRVSAYTKITPASQYSNLTVHFFVPYTAFINSSLHQDNSHIRLYAEVYSIFNKALIIRSEPITFIMKK